MARGKTKIALITDEKVLKSTFQKRKKGVIKKVKELTTLCDIIACVIIYSPPIGGRPPEIFTWPEEQDRVHAAIRMYQEKMDHSRRTADLCNYLKDRRRLETADQVVALAGCGGFHERWVDLSIPPELAVAYLNWVDARIKAVEERIALVRSTIVNESQNTMYDDLMLMPAVSNQVQNLSVQEWSYSQNPYEDFPQYDQTLYGYNSLYTSSMSDMVQFQSTQPNPITCCYQQNQVLFQNFDQTHAQNQNQMVLYDPYLLGMEQSNTMALNIYYQQQQQQQQQQRDEKMQYLNNVAHQPLICSNMDDLMQLCPYPDDWSSPDASSNYSSSSSNQFNKAAFDVPRFEDQLDYFLKTADEILPQGGGAGGTLPSRH